MTELFIIKKVELLSMLFPKASFKYYQSPTGTTHFIIVEGADMDSDDFVDAQYDIVSEFLDKFGFETIAFAPVEELQLFPSLKFKYEPINIWGRLFEEISNHATSFTPATSVEYCPPYALAA